MRNKRQKKKKDVLEFLMLRFNSDRLVFHIYSQDFTYTCLIRFSNAAFKLLKKNDIFTSWFKKKRKSTDKTHNPEEEN